MQHHDALRRLRSMFSRRSADPAKNQPAEPSLSGPTLFEQEPALAKDAGQHTRNASAWAAGGQPTE